MISMIETMDHMKVIDEAENGKELLLILEEKQPDLILMDLKMPVMDGIEASEYIKSHYKDLKIIVLSMYDDSKFIRHLVQLGINGYLLKNTDPDIIEATIHKVMQEGSYFHDRVNKTMQEGFLEEEKPVFNTEFELNVHELELMKYICMDLDVKEISRKLSISSDIVEDLQSKLIKKLNSTSNLNSINT